MILWRFVDGKPGHENQTRGLAQALAARVPLTVHELPAVSAGRALAWWFAGRFPPGQGLPDPHVLLGAGHATHLPLLAARRARGGRAVVLMKPSLPLAWFDLVVAPRHDAVSGPNVISTRGVLNAVRPGPKRQDAGLLLVGGPSRHVRWDSQQVLEQLRAIVAEDPARCWILATSRRTPADFVERARNLFAGARVEIVPPEIVPPAWLPQTLAAMPVVWVTADSVSMLYEALSSGAAVGLIEVPGRGRGRLQEGVAELLREGRVVSFAAWRGGVPLEPAPPLAEADRVAEVVLARRWHQGGGQAGP